MNPPHFVQAALAPAGHPTAADDADEWIAARSPLRIRACVPIALPGTDSASFVSFDGFADDAEHFAIRFGNIDSCSVPRVRMHSECVTGDVFESLRCDCGPQLRQAVETLKTIGGILIAYFA